MKTMPLVGAGVGFVAAVGLGVAAGVLLAQQTGRWMWVLGGLIAGLALGAYGVYRLLRSAL